MADTDYIGFTYNGVHSSELGIVRVSDGSRYNEDLLPSSQDKTVQVPGGDGTYFFGSNFTQRQFNVSYAFDSLTEQQLNRIKFLFGDKKVHELVFDETPFKTFYAKVTGQASMKYLAFEDEVKGRIYKGEGTINFTCYNPYARCFKDKINSYKQKTNYKEWKDGANFYEGSKTLDKISNGNIIVYNPGDKAADFVLTLQGWSKTIDDDTIQRIIYGGTIQIDKGVESLTLREFTLEGNDTHVKINTKINLIEGYRPKEGYTNVLERSGNIYNHYIESGDFFKIPVTVNKFSETKDQTYNTLSLGNGNEAISNNFVGIEYDYYYL